MKKPQVKLLELDEFELTACIRELTNQESAYVPQCPLRLRSRASPLCQLIDGSSRNPDTNIASAFVLPIDICSIAGR